ncbi:hypothetical protein [Azospirillum palustre]
MDASLVKNINYEDTAIFFEGHFSSLKLVESNPQESGRPHSTSDFTSNNYLWDAVMDERIRSGHRLHLRGFYVMEWLPRSPGLFFTEQGRRARRQAEKFIIDKRSRRLTGISDHYTVYDPYGKSSMLRGGIGCVRLKDINLNGSKYWMFTATSNAVAHEGLPIAVPHEAYSCIIDQIAQEGAAFCEISGVIDFAPERLLSLYNQAHIPQVVLYVDNIRSIGHARLERPEVTAGIMFESEYEGRASQYASFVTFDPSRRGDLRDATEWIESEYVSSLYRGRIILDFDEQVKRFESAKFSLQETLSGDIDDNELRNFLSQFRRLGSVEAFIADYRKLLLTKNGATIIIAEKVINIGDGNTISAPVVIADTIQDSFKAISESQTPTDLRQLLESLVAETAKLPPDDKGKKVVGDVNMAVKELTREEPDNDIATRYLTKAKAVATTMGEVAAPILSTAEKVIGLLT